MQALYSWDDDAIEFLPNASNFAYAISLPAISILVTQRGVRPAALLGAAVMLLSVALGGLFFCLSPPFARSQYWLPLLSQVLNGVAAPIQNITVSLVAERWFPVRERTFATSVLVAACFGGSILSFALPTQFIPPPFSNNDEVHSGAAASLSGSAAEDREIESNALMALRGIRQMYLGGAVATALLAIAIGGYFPERPPRCGAYPHTLTSSLHLEHIYRLTRVLMFSSCGC